MTRLIVLACGALASAQTVSLFAGSPLGASGAADGIGSAARFFTPTGLVALAGGLVIASDFDNGRLRAVSTADAAVRTFIGPLANARPTGLALDPAARTIYMADALNHNVLRINVSTPPTWAILAGSAIQTQGFVNGIGTIAKFSTPQGLATDSAGMVYVADFENTVIRSITPSGIVAVFAGSGSFGFNDGPALDASFRKPSAIAIDGAGNKYVADTWNYLIRLINPAGIVSTLAGQTTRGFRDGVGTLAAFFNPRGVTLAPPGLIIADTSNNALRCLDLTTLAVTTLAGNGSAGSTNGVGTAATLRAPIGSVVVGGNLLLADSGANTLRLVSGLALPSPTSTPTPIPTSTTTPALASPTATPSATPSDTPTPSPSSTSSLTMGMSPSPSPSVSGSPSLTPTPTPTPSQTPSTGSSSTSTPSPTLTPAAAATPPLPPSPPATPAAPSSLSQRDPSSTPLSSGGIAGIVIASLAAVALGSGAYLYVGRRGPPSCMGKGLAPVSSSPSPSAGSTVTRNPLALEMVKQRSPPGGVTAL